MPSLLDKLWPTIKAAKTPDEARLAFKDAGIDPDTGTPVGGSDNTHVHVHLEGGKKANGMDEDPDIDPDPTGEPDIKDLAAQVAALTQKVAQLEAMLSDDEDVELEDPGNTQDVRRFRMRRRDKMKTTKDEGDTPDPTPEIIGETDLPGIEDLDARMPTATEDAKRRARAKFMSTRDSADQETIWQETLAGAEILSPGIKVGTFDARLPMKRTAERICAMRRRALEGAYKDDASREVLKEVTGIATFDGYKGMPCDTVKMAFVASVNAIRSHNNDSQTRTGAPVGGTRTGDGGAGSAPKVPTVAEINARNRDFWDRQKGNGARR